MAAGERGVVVLNSTPFYGESGGQVGDCGLLQGESSRADVTDTTKAQGHHFHHVHVTSGSLNVGDVLAATVDNELRQRIRLNHSATHLLHEALRRVLGDHVVQKGSLVDSERLRFDFSHGEAVSAAQIEELTQIVNEQIRGNSATTTQLMDMDSAVAAGATALFGEKYGDEVRVLSMGSEGFSVELCGGTHVDRTGDIGLLLVTGESGVAAGVRRIEAITGQAALIQSLASSQRVADVAEVLKATPAAVVEKAGVLRSEVRELEKEVERLKQKLATSSGGDLTQSAVEVGGIRVLATQIEGADVATLRDTLDQCKNKLGTAVVLLAAVEGDKISLVAGVTKDVTDRVRAGDAIKEFAGRLGGKGGGRPDMAQGGGTDVAALPAALAAVPDWVASQLA